MTTNPLTKAARSMSMHVSDYVALAKPRVTVLVAASVGAGYYLGHRGPFTIVNVVGLLTAILTVGLVVIGGNAFNQLIERESDARMQRTANRPLPAGRLRPRDALVFALIVSTVGIALVAVLLNGTAATLAVISLGIYVLVYTPLKSVTPLAVLVGAAPGALPTVIGWAAAAGSAELGAWLLFSIVFVWQLPHFQAISWLYREDYCSAGHRVLSVVEPTGRRMVAIMIGCSLVLIPVSVLPTYFHLAGVVYYLGAVVLGFAFLAFALEVARLRTRASAREHLTASLAYLTLLLALMSANKLM